MSHCYMGRYGALQGEFIGFTGQGYFDPAVFTYNVLAHYTAALLEHGYVLAHVSGYDAKGKERFSADEYVPYGTVSPMREYKEKPYPAMPPCTQEEIDAYEF